MTQEAALLRLDADRKLINRWLDAALRPDKDVPKRLNDAMRYAALGPGKRLRPILCLEAYRARSREQRAGSREQGAESREQKEVGPFCCGIEMIHAFSLAHDDLPSMDDDDFRRGRPSLHRKFDEATAILAADALFARAFELFASSAAEAGRVRAAVELVARAVGPAGMAGGQMLDVGSSLGAGKRTVTMMQEKKTAMLFAAALAAGSLVGGADQRTTGRIWQAGMSLGLLFQVTDDLLDAGGQDKGKATSLGAAGRAGATKSARVLAQRAAKQFRSLGPAYEFLALVPGMVMGRKR